MGEKKEYRSAVRSRRLIHQAFLELLQENKVTWTDTLPINLSAPNSDACEAFRAVISELKEREVL